MLLRNPSPWPCQSFISSPLSFLSLRINPPLTPISHHQIPTQSAVAALTLSRLQTKAETKISQAHKLISEKETELHVAEETLSGLKEVEIDYSGNEEETTVELAGSFNGWDHNITMDLIQPSSSGSRIWRAVLWLYPGVYEIKFIIDGHWKIDPLRESITWNGVHNNILRVDR